MKPNLVQTLENNLALIHGGPFANIAHGCNSAIATKTALKLADYVVTEAGFGADLGAEKFIDIKCRQAKLAPCVVVLVATVRALKYHGGAKKLDLEDLDALSRGITNLERHMQNIKTHYNLPCVVSINHFMHDTQAEIDLLQSEVEKLGGKVEIAKHWEKGSVGAEKLAKTVADIADNAPGKHQYIYQDNMSLWEKIEAVATKIYGAKNISANVKIRNKLTQLDKTSRNLPICIAKTQMSFTTDPTILGAPTGHTIEISDVRLSNGAGFIVAIAGNIMTMPGLPKIPAAEK